MIVFYNLGLFLYRITIQCFAFFNPKARLWIDGRKNIFDSLSNKVNSNRPTIWMHCASLGEFEQGRPLLEQLKARHPNYQIVLSFFSPSGYEIRKDYPFADVVTYLPLDSKKNAQQWIKVVRPKVAIFVKYEFWYHYINELKQAKTPALLISATFRPSQVFFQFYGDFFRKILQSFQHIFVQTKEDQRLLQEIKIDPVSVCGDTRVDRVIDIAKSSKTFPLIEQFVTDKKILILGSSWPEEEKLLIILLEKQPLFLQDWKIIIAPHDIAPAHITAIENSLPVTSALYSKGEGDKLKETSVLIIDNIGILSSLYQYGEVAFIGGGFGNGIHNILEPITFGLPVLFGPKFKKFTEANALVETGGAFCIRNAEELNNQLLELQKEEVYQQASQQTVLYLQTNQGATTKIGDFLDTILQTT